MAASSPSTAPSTGPPRKEIAKLFAEVVIAPEIDAEARAILTARKNLRVLVAGAMPDPGGGGMMVRSLAGGYLLQGRDAALSDDELKVVTQRAPSAAEMADLRFAFTVAKHVKSNAIVYARDGATVGVGAGQMSRSIRRASPRGRPAKPPRRRIGGQPGGRLGGRVGRFFPFADGLMAAIQAGATAVIQPGGSVRDDEVIAPPDAAGVAMVLTGMRHFRIEGSLWVSGTGPTPGPTGRMGNTLDRDMGNTFRYPRTGLGRRFRRLDRDLIKGTVYIFKSEICILSLIIFLISCPHIRVQVHSNPITDESRQSMARRGKYWRFCLIELRHAGNP